MHITAPPRKKMTADEFIAWAMKQPETEHYELFDGEVVPMAPARSLHALTKLEITVALREAIRRAGLRCWVYPDGMAVQLDSGTVYEPDALLRCGNPLGRNVVKITDPVVIVEIASPSTSRIDSGIKLSDYFQLPSLQHYLQIDALRRVIVHYKRTGADLETRIITDGHIRLDPPGIELVDPFPPADAVPEE